MDHSNIPRIAAYAIIVSISIFFIKSVFSHECTVPIDIDKIFNDNDTDYYEEIIQEGTLKRRPKRKRIHKVKLDYDPHRTPVVTPSFNEHKASVIFLPSRGDVGWDWAPKIRNILLPYLKVIYPTANVLPITLNNGMRMTSWYDVRKPGAEEDVHGINKSARYIHHLIDYEIDIGIPPEKIILAGFSQGASMAIHAARSYPRKLAAVIAITPLVALSETDKFDKTPNNNITIYFMKANLEHPSELETECNDIIRKTDAATLITFKGLDEMREVFRKEFIPAGKRRKVHH